MKKRSLIAILLLSSLLSIFLFAGSVSAATFTANITNSTGGNYSEANFYQLYNITINNTDSTKNITHVFIANLSGSVYFTSPFLNTNLNATFNSTGSSLNLSSINVSGNNWTNGTLGFFWFNATARQIGNFSFNISTVDDTGTIVSAILNITFFDTTVPTISFQSPTPGDTFTLNAPAIPVNVSFVEYGSGVNNVTIYLYNSVYSYAGSSPISINGTILNGNISYFYNFTGLADGVYYLNATVFDNLNLSSNTSTRTFLINTSTASGSPSCSANWNVVWGPCLNGSQTQIWTDLSGCGGSAPSATSRTCVGSSNNTCTTVWNCTLTWTPAVCTNGTQTRVCTDINGCTAAKTESRDCVLGSSLTTNTTSSTTSTGTSSQSLSYAFYAIGGVVIAGVIAVVIILMRLKRKSFSGGDFGRPKPSMLGGAFKPASPSYPAGHL